MKISISWLERQIACCLVTLLVAPFAEAATTRLPPAPQAAEAAVAGQAQPQADARGTSEAAADAGQSAPYPDSPGAAQAQAADQSQQPAASSGVPANQQSPGPPPVGTAAAPYVKPGGVAASRPAGAAIAPAKQRRTRSFAIKVGLLVGAGIAIGVVTAVSLGSPSRPH
jgi:hypothetical protein